jgi:hypothetical protein
MVVHILKLTRIAGNYTKRKPFTHLFPFFLNLWCKKGDSATSNALFFFYFFFGQKIQNGFDIVGARNIMEKHSEQRRAC